MRNEWSSALEAVISPDGREAGNMTNSRAIIDACRPFHWKDDFPAGISPEPAVIKDAYEKRGYPRDKP